MTDEMQDARRGSAERLADILTRKIGGDKVFASGAAYEKACRLWNAAVVSRPDLVIMCESTEDVRLSVIAARATGHSVSVRGGGHDWAGRALRGDIVLDLSRMNDVTIDGDVARVQGGATAMDVARVVSAEGRVAVTGIIGSVGIAALVTGGGYGHLTAKFGLGLDNLLGAELVLADGRVVYTDPNEEPDLFWAIRGGGGNLGVVTGLVLRLHPVPDISDGIVAFPWDQAPKVFANYAAAIDDFPHELTVMPTFFAAPTGELSVLLHHAHCGAEGDDARIIEMVAGLGEPSTVNVTRKTLAEILEEAEHRTMEGIHWIVRTVTLPALGPEAVAIIQRAMEARSSPLSWIAAHPFYGAGEDIPEGATAFGIRRRHQMVGIYTAWEPGDDTPHRAWADAVEASLRPYALDSAYPNYFGSDRPEQAEQAYGANAERLLDIKKRYDPDGVFAAISLPRRPAAARE